MWILSVYPKISSLILYFFSFHLIYQATLVMCYSTVFHSIPRLYKSEDHSQYFVHNFTSPPRHLWLEMTFPHSHTISKQNVPISKALKARLVLQNTRPTPTFIIDPFLNSSIPHPYSKTISNCLYSAFDEALQEMVGYINLCRGIRGHIERKGDVIKIQPLLDGDSSISIRSPHKVTYIGSKTSFMENTRSKYALNLPDKFNTILKRRKRQAPSSNDASYSIKFPRSLKSADPYVVELLIVIEDGLYALYKEKDFSLELLVNKVHEIVALLNMAYKIFGIQFVLVRVNMFERNRDCWSTCRDFEIMRSLLTMKQSENHVLNVRHDCLHALVARGPKSVLIGKAKSNSMCSPTDCYGYSIDSPNESVNDVARTVIHEIGHNFGLIHDTEICSCQDCIMSTGSEVDSHALRWSKCSQQRMKDLLQYGGVGWCLKEKAIKQPKFRVIGRIFKYNLLETSNSKSFCGNGLVESGEDCDCGSPDSCPDSIQRCCNPKTCRFQNEATCASGPCCNLDTCNLVSAGSQCRGRNTPCDLEEFCNGTSEWCPTDVTMADGIPCKTEAVQDDAYCYKGDCKSSKSWCRALWGNTATASNDFCFRKNLGKPDMVKNCGTDHFNKTITKEDTPITCRTDEDRICGRLWCNHLNEKMVHVGSVKEVVESDNNNGYCYAIRFQTAWDQPDLGVVPNGTKCGVDKMCLGSRCVPAALMVPGPNLSMISAPSSCHCNGRGVCNSLGNCHCDPYWGPPNCNIMGVGGSIDSGPAMTNESLRGNQIAVILIVLLLVLPLMICAIVLIVVLYRNPFALDNTCDTYFKRAARSSRSKPSYTASLYEQGSPSPPKINPNQYKFVSTDPDCIDYKPVNGGINKSNNIPEPLVKHSNGRVLVPYSRPHVKPGENNMNSGPDEYDERRKPLVSHPVMDYVSVDTSIGYIDLRKKSDGDMSQSIFDELSVVHGHDYNKDAEKMNGSTYSTKISATQPKFVKQRSSSRSDLATCDHEKMNTSSTPGTPSLAGPLPKHMKKSASRSPAISRSGSSLGGTSLKEKLKFGAGGSALVHSPSLSSQRRPEISLPKLEDTTCTVDTHHLPATNYSLVRDVVPTRPGALAEGRAKLGVSNDRLNHSSAMERAKIGRSNEHLNSSSAMIDNKRPKPVIKPKPGLSSNESLNDNNPSGTNKRPKPIVKPKPNMSSNESLDDIATNRRPKPSIKPKPSKVTLQPSQIQGGGLDWQEDYVDL